MATHPLISSQSTTFTISLPSFYACATRSCSNYSNNQFWMKLIRNLCFCINLPYNLVIICFLHFSCLTASLTCPISTILFTITITYSSSTPSFFKTPSITFIIISLCFYLTFILLFTKLSAIKLHTPKQQFNKFLRILLSSYSKICSTKFESRYFCVYLSMIVVNSCMGNAELYSDRMNG